MKLIAVCFALFLVASALSVTAAETWTGSIGDKMCGAEHPKGQDAAKCTADCIKHGSPYIFVVSKDKVYEIQNEKDEKINSELAKHAGKQVEVTGTMSKDGKSVKIDSIKSKAR